MVMGSRLVGSRLVGSRLVVMRSGLLSCEDWRLEVVFNCLYVTHVSHLYTIHIRTCICTI